MYISADTGSSVWLYGKTNLASDCDKAVECNGTIKHSVSEEPIYFFHWMNKIKLKKHEDCIAVENSGRIRSKKCDGKRFFICQHKLRPGNRVTASRNAMADVFSCLVILV